MRTYSFTTCFPGFQNGLIGETISEQLPVTVSMCSNDYVKHLLLVLKAVPDELLQWDQLARQSPHFTVVNWFLAKRGEKLLCTCTMPSLGPAPHFCLIQLKTISHAFSGGSRSPVAALLALQAGRGKGRVRMWDRGMEELCLSSQLLYIAIVLQSCCGLAPPE